MQGNRPTTAPLLPPHGMLRSFMLRDLLSADRLAKGQRDDERAHDGNDCRDEELHHAVGADADDADDAAGSLRDGQHVDHGGVRGADASADEGDVEGKAQGRVRVERYVREHAAQLDCARAARDAGRLPGRRFLRFSRISQVHRSHSHGGATGRKDRTRGDGAAGDADGGAKEASAEASG